MNSFKILVFVLICNTFFAGNSHSQSVYYGINQSGGYGRGCIFKYSDINSSPEIIYKFEQNPNDPGTNPEFYVHTDNNLYAFEISGTTPVLNCYNPATHQTAILSQLDYSCQYTMGKPVRGANGNLYGIIGNTNSVNGAIISYSFQTNKISIITYFPDSIGIPLTNLVKTSNGKYYFTTEEGIACFDPSLIPSQSVYLAYKTTDYVVTWGGTGDLIETTNNQLIGTFNTLSTTTPSYIFSYNFITDTLINLLNFTSSNDVYLQGLIQSPFDQKFYGLTNVGSGTDGCLYSFDLSTHQRTILHYFDEDRSKGKLTASGSKLYGSSEKGQNGRGSIFCYDLATGNFETLYELQNTDKSLKPIGTLSLHPNGKLYGVTNQSTVYLGGFFSLNPSNNEFEELFFYNQSKYGGPGDFIMGPNNQLYGLSVNNHANYQLDTTFLYTLNTSNDQVQFLTMLPGSGFMSQNIAASNDKIYVSSIQYTQSDNITRITEYDILTQQTSILHISVNYPMMTDFIVTEDNSKLIGYCLTSENTSGLCSFSLDTHQITLIQSINNTTYSKNTLIRDTAGTIYTLTHPIGGSSNLIAIHPQSETVTILRQFTEAGVLPNICLGNDQKIYGFIRTPNGSSADVAMYSYDLGTGYYSPNIGITFNFDLIVTDDFFMGSDNNFHGFTYTPLSDSLLPGDAIFQIDPTLEMAYRSTISTIHSQFLSYGPIELPNPNGFLESDGNYSWNLFPNPTTGNIFINCNETPSHIRVIDIMGNMLYELAAPQNAFNTLYIDQLNVGMYYIQIDFPNGSITTNFVKL